MAGNSKTYHRSQMIVGQRVLDRMAALGITQAELARRVGVAQPTINNLIHRSKKGSSHLHKVARELETTPGYLTGETDDPALGPVVGHFLSADDAELLRLFAALTPARRRTVRALLKDLTQLT